MSAAIDLSRRRLCAAAISLPLAGCVVTPYGTYYRPSTAQPGAQERRAWCQGAAGPVTGLQMDLGGGLKLRASTDKVQPSGLPVRVEFAVPAGTALRFLGDVRIVSAGVALAVPVSATALRSMAVAPDAWVDPPALRPGAAGLRDSPHGEISLRTQPLVVPPPQRAVVQGLVLVRDGAMIAVPPVTMERLGSGRQPYAYRSAQEQAALLARAAACRRDTPQLACQNIIDFAGASHTGEQAGLRWSWRWWVAPHAVPTVDGELKVSVLEPGRWRLDATRLQLQDADSGASHPVRLAPGVLSFADRVELQRGIGESGADTRLLLEAMLPARVADFELLLPPLLRNGERIVLAPLSFARRSFDGGVEPFNC